MVMTNNKLFLAAESKLDKNYYLNDCKYCGELERERERERERPAQRIWA